MVSVDVVDAMHIATHPSRVRIATQLAKSNGLTVTELVERVKSLPEHIIRFHLAVLEQNGLITSEEETGNPQAKPRILIRFKLSPKFHEVLQAAPNLVSK